MTMLADVPTTADAPIPTWFGVGGRADHLARPRSIAEVRSCLQLEAAPRIRILGDGANLLVNDDGVDGLVISLNAPAMREVWHGGQARPAAFPAEIEPRTAGCTLAMAGANLPKLIVAAGKLGHGGLESLGGIPATVGGAAVMNAGGAFGEIASHIAAVHILTRGDNPEYRVLSRGEIAFGYRRSGLERHIILAVELRLEPADPKQLRDRLLEVMAYKKGTQPMGDASAGCAFKNPTLKSDQPDLQREASAAAPDRGRAGTRISAGLLIDRSGCKGLSVGSAVVSTHHANFITVAKGGLAGDVLTLMDLVTQRVMDRFGVQLEPEIVIWRRNRA